MQNMHFKMTKAQALQIQAEHVNHYTARYGEWLREAVAARTTADQLPDEGEIDVVIVNRHIPRGGAIESLIEQHLQVRTQVSDKFS
jgi:hypothetical protein